MSKGVTWDVKAMLYNRRSRIGSEVRGSKRGKKGLNIPDGRSKEGLLADVERAVQDRNFESVEDLHRYLNRPGSLGSIDRDKPVENS